jgi:hypothetical protein
MPAPETLTLRATAIAGQRYADDYAVIWRGMSVGRIMLGNGAPHDRPNGSWRQSPSVPKTVLGRLQQLPRRRIAPASAHSRVP